MPYNVYAFGSNGSGQLGIGHAEDVSTPALCIMPGQQLKSQPICIAAGGNHTILRCEDGTAYVTGADIAGLCSSLMQHDDSPRDRFHKIEFPHPIHGGMVDRFKLCAATWEASILVTEDDAIYTHGRGAKGELGQGLDVTESSEPRLLQKFPPPGLRIAQISSCMSHTAALLSTGELYAWGNGRKGQLGQPAEVVWQPRKFAEIGVKVERVVCGREFTCVVGVSERGDVMVLGSDKGNVKSDCPQNLHDWTCVAASWGSLFALIKDGQILSWGRNDRGQLTPSDTPKLVSFAAGSEHVLAETAGGNVIAWGWGEHGNCGQQVDDSQASEKGWTKIECPTPDAKVLGAGCATSWLVGEV